MEESGEDAVFKKIGVEPTGMPFNSVVALGMHNNKAVNPLVNAGAMASVSLVKASSAAERWDKILAYQSKFAGEQLKLIDEVYKSESDSNFRNRGIAWILYNNENLFCDPPEATDVYTKQCSIGVTAKQLAVMGATLANGGVNPITKERCLDSKYVPRALAVMMMAGFYDESGAWAYNDGLPAKTGVGGGIVAVVPGKMAIVGFSPPVNEAGNSVRATEAIDYIVKATRPGPVWLAQVTLKTFHLEIAYENENDESVLCGHCVDCRRHHDGAGPIVRARPGQVRHANDAKKHGGNAEENQRAGSGERRGGRTGRHECRGGGHLYDPAATHRRTRQPGRRPC